MSKNEMQELQERIAQLEAHNARLVDAATKRNNQAISAKIGEKGGVSLTGVGRYPVTLYYGQWVRVLNSLDVPAENWFRIQIEEWKADGLLSLKEHEKAV
jgi:hypothetical protein